MSIYTDPGTIPSSFDTISQHILNTESLNKEDFFSVRINQCSKCELIRPPRAHHCSLCNRCILKMDHHCPWIGNCVGFGNHRYFVQFLVYTAVSCLNLGFSLMAGLREMDWEENIEEFIGCVAGLGLSLSVGSLAIFHVYLVRVNQTTLEMSFNKKFNVFDTRSGKRNCAQVFGERFWGKVFPLRTGYGVDGVVYPVRIRSQAGETLVIEDKLLA